MCKLLLLLHIINDKKIFFWLKITQNWQISEKSEKPLKLPLIAAQRLSKIKKKGVCKTIVIPQF